MTLQVFNKTCIPSFHLPICPAHGNQTWTSPTAGHSPPTPSPITIWAPHGAPGDHIRSEGVGAHLRWRVNLLTDGRRAARLGGRWFFPHIDRAVVRFSPWRGPKKAARRGRFCLSDRGRTLLKTPRCPLAMVKIRNRRAMVRSGRPPAKNNSITAVGVILQ